MKLRTPQHLKQLTGKHILLRIDANVPLKNGKIVDDYKLMKTLPTITYLLKQKAKVLIVSHLGRPRGYDKKLSLRPVVTYFEKKLRKPILFINPFSLKEGWERAILVSEEMKNGEVVMFENIRFDTDEEKNTGMLAKTLSQLADFFVLDGFGVAHRDAASVTGVAGFLPAYAGLLFEEEVDLLSRVVEKPHRPLIVVLGGAKMETKIPLIKNFIKKADYILLGGGIIATYLRFKGNKVGVSLVEEQLPHETFKLLENKKIVLPIDVVCGSQRGKEVTIVPLTSAFKIPHSRQGIYDLGPQTLKEYAQYLKKAQTIVWNGALGYFEQAPYQRGTFELANMLARETRRGAFTVCGGGETEQVLRQLKLDKKMSLVSTGGGAMLEFLSGKVLPGIKTVSKHNHGKKKK